MFSVCHWPVLSTVSLCSLWTNCRGLLPRLSGGKLRPSSPVLVDIPKDIQMAQGDLDPHFSTVADEMAFPQAEVAQALQMLAQSQQPMLYVGGGVGMAQAVPALREFPGGDRGCRQPAP